MKKYLIGLLNRELRFYKSIQERGDFSDETIKKYPYRTKEYCATQRKKIQDKIKTATACLILVKQHF